MSSAALPRTGTQSRTLSRLTAIVATLLVLLVIAYSAISAYAGNSTLRTERKPLIRTPESIGLTYESVTFPSTVDQLPIAGWFVKGTGNRAIVLVHGLGSNRADTPNNFTIELAADYVKAGFNVLMIDLRGHGESGGDRLGLAWEEQRDVLGAVSYLQGRGFRSGSIGLHGSSYGAATTLNAAAASADIGAVVADSAFADFRELIDQEISRKIGAPPIFSPGISLYTSLFYGLDLPNIQPLGSVPRIAPRPIYFIHSDADRRITPDHSVRLRAVSRGAGDQLWIAPSGVVPDGKDDHVRAYRVLRQDFLARVVPFFEQNLR